MHPPDRRDYSHRHHKNRQAGDKHDHGGKSGAVFDNIEHMFLRILSMFLFYSLIVR